MDIARHIVLALHIIGIASLLGGMLVQMKSMKTGTTTIAPAIMHGAWTMLVTGIALVGLVYAGGDSPNNTKLGVKAAILIAIFVIAFMNKKKEKLASWVLPTLMMLAMANIFIATIWVGAAA